MKSHRIVPSCLFALGFGFAGTACSASASDPPDDTGVAGANNSTPGGFANTGNVGSPASGGFGGTNDVGSGGAGNTGNIGNPGNGGGGNGGSGTMYTAKDAVITGSVAQCAGTTPVTLPQDVSVPACTLDTCQHAACITAAQVQQYAPSISQATLNLQAKCPGSDAYCTPGDYIATGGHFLFKKCTARFQGMPDLEGRCISTCIPQIYNQSNYLQRDVCADSELCAPCYDPRLPAGQDLTDACKQTCDSPPPAPAPPVKFTECGNGAGLCVPSSLVPAVFQYVVPKDTCTENGYVCAPREKAKDIHYNFPQCVPSNSTIAQSAMDGPNGQKGGCVPKYLIDDYNVPGVAAIPDGFVVQDTCPDGTLCAPCNNPLATDPAKSFTGACVDPNQKPAEVSAG